MARLETQINQIYLSHPENKKTSLILYDEAINTSGHLFVLAQLQDMHKKAEANDLKKISEIILESFRINKKLKSENLFEAALAQINQNLADLAHEGRKTWVGKFSCLILLKSHELIFVANNGLTAAWLKRKGELLEILPAEKLNDHPIKTFTNFTQGKLTDEDTVIISTANIFNYISFELFGQILNQKNLSEATNEISKILKESLVPDQAYCAFFLQFTKKIQTAEDQPNNIYAPLPEEIELEANQTKFKLPSISLAGFSFRFPKLHIPKLKWDFFKNLSTAGKFFFISTSIFAILFLANLSVYIFRSQAKKTAEQVTNLSDQINKELTDAQSSLIYKNDNQALQLVADAQKNYEQLLKLDETKASNLSERMETVKNQVNKISFVTDPKIYTELKHHPIFLAKSPNGFLLANADSNSLSSYTSELTDYFLLNSLKSDIVGVGYFNVAGIVMATSDKLYHVNNNLKQYEPIVDLKDFETDALKTLGNNLYVHDKKNNLITKITYSNNKYGLAGVVRTDKDLRDFTIDSSDIYLLYPDHLNKSSSGKLLAITYPTLADPITNATKIIAGANLYILEPTKKRLIITNKNGVLQNQIYFPTTSTLLDFWVDEKSRNLYLLDDNKLYKVTL